MPVYLPGQGDVQAVDQERDKDVGLDLWFELMIDWSDRQITFKVAECLLDSGELQLVAPQLGGITAGEIGAPQIASLATAWLFELVQPETESEVGILLIDLHLACRAELHQ